MIDFLQFAQVMAIMSAIFFGGVSFLRAVTASEKKHLAVAAASFLAASFCFALAFSMNSSPS